MNNTSNLGKGLEELLGTSLPDIKNTKEISDIDIKLIQPGKYQPRIKIVEGELTELAESIKEKGVIDAGAAAVRQLTAKLPEFSFRSFFVIG